MKAKIINPIELQMGNKIWEEFKSELIVLDALKIAAKSTGFVNYIEVFNSERVKLLKRVKNRIEVAHN